MCTIHVGIGHDNDFFITKIVFVVMLFYTAAQSFAHIFYFLILQDFVKAGAGNVQNLPRRGRMACKRTRPCRAEPPAESSSTMKISVSRAAACEQSASFPGRRSRLVWCFAVLTPSPFFLFTCFSPLNNVFQQCGGIFHIRRQPVVK